MGISLPSPTKGDPGLAATVAVTAPTSRALNMATAYQALDPTKPAIVTVTVTSTSSVSLSGAVSNAASILIGSSSTLVSSSGIAIGTYENVLGGTLVAGLNMSNKATCSYVVFLPAGWYFAIKQTGTGVSVVSAFEQKIN